MADVQSERTTQTFENTVLGALICAKSELIKNGCYNNTASKALNEMKMLVSSVTKKNFGNNAQLLGYKYSVVHAFPMLARIAQRWYRHFMRRMIAKCAVRHPWTVIYEDVISRELFEIVERIVSRTDYAVIVQRTEKKCFMAFTNARRVRRLFSDIMDVELERETFLKKKKLLRRVEVIIDDDKQFAVCYNYKTEEIKFEFFYGMWNQYGWPQHV